MGTPTIASDPSAVSESAFPSCTTAVPGKYGYVPPDACNALYLFNPSFAGNLAFAVVFGLSFTVHFVEAIVFKKRFCWVLLMGVGWEMAAFIIRTLGAHDQQKHQYALWGELLFLLAPLWVNAFAYMTVARMIYFALPDQKVWGIRAIRLTVLFVWLDVVCFLIQLVGGAILSSDDIKIAKIGQKLYMVGIGVQMGFILIFGSMTIAFYMKLRQLSGTLIKRVKLLTWAMLALMVLILVRIIFRLVEFGPGVDEHNPLLASEYYVMFLDAFPMAVSLVLLNVLHPGMVLRGPDSEFPRVSRAEKKALKQQKKDEKRRRKAAKKGDQFALVEYARGDFDRQGSDDGRRLMV